MITAEDKERNNYAGKYQVRRRNINMAIGQKSGLQIL